MSTDAAAVTQPLAGSNLRGLAGVFLCGFLAFGVGAYAFTQFQVPLGAEFHWDRETLGGLMSAFWLSAPFALVSAYLMDRLGVPTLVLIGGVIETLGLAGMMLADKAPEFYLLRFCMGVGKVLIVTPLPPMAARLFPGRPGLAIAVSLCGWHIGGLVMAPLSALFIQQHGWRMALLLVCALLAAGIVLAVAFLRGQGRSVETPAIEPAGERAGPRLIGSVTAVAAICLGTVAFYCGYAGLLGQLSPMLTDAGYDAAAVGGLTGSVAICAAVCVLVAGVATQWFSARTTGVAVLVLMALATGGAATLGPGSAGWRAVGVVILLGALVGAGDPIIIDALRRVVRPHWFGRAYGWWYLLCLIALTAAPFAVGAVFDVFHSYNVAFIAIAIACVITAGGWLMKVR